MLFTPQTPTRRSFRGPAVSLLWHSVVVVWIMMPTVPPTSPSEYRQKIAGKESKIVFYKFRRELPKVTPPKAKSEKLPLRAEVKAKQAIVSSPKNAPQAARMIWTPAPEIAPAKAEASDLLKARVALSTTLPTIDPLVPPLPICSVPAEIVVAPI